MQMPFCSRSLTPNDGSINGEAEKKFSLGNELTTKTSLERAKGWVKLMLAAEKGWSRNFPCSPLFIFSGQKVVDRSFALISAFYTVPITTTTVLYTVVAAYPI